MPISPTLQLPISLFLAFAVCSFASGEQLWGDLTGTIVLKGEAPELPELDTGNDEYCCNADPQNESLVLSDDHGIANVVVYLRGPRGEQVAAHPNYEESRSRPVEFDNKSCAFTPHVVLVRTSQPLLLKNTDKVNHNVKGELGDEAFNFMLSAGGTQELSFDVAQRVPRPVACSIHPFMRGWLLVRDDPYMTVTDKDGHFTLANLPAGEHEIQFWHERPGYLKECRSDTHQLDRRGRIRVVIEDGSTTDLGIIEVDADLMAEQGG